MDASQIMVIALVTATVGLLIWIEIRSRRGRKTEAADVGAEKLEDRK